MQESLANTWSNGGERTCHTREEHKDHRHQRPASQSSHTIPLSTFPLEGRPRSWSCCHNQHLQFRCWMPSSCPSYFRRPIVVLVLQQCLFAQTRLQLVMTDSPICLSKSVSIPTRCLSLAVPSQAITKNSSSDETSCITTSGKAVTICCSGARSALFLNSKSPIALERARLPFTRPKSTKPPAAVIRAFSPVNSGVSSAQ